jgi:hypothetical protein
MAQVASARAETAEILDDAGLVRLTVKLSRSVADALKTLTRKHGSTMTEEVRRALSLWKYIDDERERGSSLLIERDGRFREILIDVLRTPEA